jgi:hypothetical protein
MERLILPYTPQSRSREHCRFSNLVVVYVILHIDTRVLRY